LLGQDRKRNLGLMHAEIAFAGGPAAAGATCHLPWFGWSVRLVTVAISERYSERCCLLVCVVSYMTFFCIDYYRDMVLNIRLEKDDKLPP
jgi:hypothetical protein